MIELMFYWKDGLCRKPGEEKFNLSCCARTAGAGESPGFGCQLAFLAASDNDAAQGWN